MAYYSGFQSNAFQGNAFQIKRGSNVVLLGGGPSPGEKEHTYNPHVFRFKQEELKRQAIAKHRAELKRVENELAEAERKRIESQAMLKAKNAAKKLAALEAQLQEEISRLRMERVWLIRLIDDEEAILILMMVRRRRHLI